MKGYKTIITAAISVIMGLATMLGITLDAQTMAAIAENLEIVIGSGMTLYGLVMGVLRAFTSSSMFNGKNPSPNTLNALIPVFAVILVVGLQGCVAQPRIQTPEDQVAVAYATINALTSTTQKAYAEKRISKDQGKKILADLREARRDAQIAEDLIVEGRPEDGVQGLLVVNRLLLVLEQRIKERAK